MPRQIFGKVTAYQYQGKMYKSKEKFLEVAVESLIFRAMLASGRRHADYNTGWSETRRVLSMEERMPELQAKTRRRLERIIARQ